MLLHARNYLLLLLLFSYQLATAQIIPPGSKAERRAQAASYLQHLQSAGLVVRLPTNYKKIAAMERLIKTGNLSAERQESLVERLALERTRTLAHQQMLVRVFREHYHHGPVYFMADSSYNAFVEDPLSVLFWNDDLQIDRSIAGPGPDGLVMHVDYLNPNNANALSQDLVLTDRTRRIPAKPFPEVTNRLGTVFSDKEATYISVLKKWSQRLDQLAEKIKVWSQ